MGLPIGRALDTIDHVLGAVELLAPLIREISDYTSGKTAQPPPNLPDKLRSEVELMRLKARQTRP